MNYSSAQLALEKYFADRWTTTLVSYQSQNIPLPAGRPTATEPWVRLTVSGVGMGRRSLGRGEPWSVWGFIVTHQLFVPLSTGHDISDGYVSDLLLVWRDLDFCVPGAGARWVCVDPSFAPTSRQEQEWFSTMFSQPLQLEWRG